MRRLTYVAALAAMTWWLIAAIAAGSAAAATPYKDIASVGPLEHVYLGNELSCQVAHTGDAALEFYPPSTIPGDCGTFVVVGANLYAPDFVSHGGTATGSLGVYAPFTPVSQSSVTGTGTAADPFRVVTDADVGVTGLHIHETDSYVIADEAYRTDVTVSNIATAGISGILYRAGDCYLGGSDVGYGFTETFGTRKAVGCSINPNNSPPGRIEEWVPLTGGNNFYESFYGSVWSWIGGHTSFPDTCDCTTFQDNGGGLSWTFDIAVGSSATFSQVTTFSPSGRQALVTSKTADSGTAVAGGQDGYTITHRTASAATTTSAPAATAAATTATTTSATSTTTPATSTATARAPGLLARLLEEPPRGVARVHAEPDGGQRLHRRRKPRLEHAQAGAGLQRRPGDRRCEADPAPASRCGG